MVTSEAISWKTSLTLVTLAYATYQDIRKISGLKDQTVIVVKAPPETRLEVPDPVEVRTCLCLSAEIFLERLKLTSH